MLFRIRPVSLGFAMLLLLPGVASARAMRMMETSPVAEALVDGQNQQYVVRFDGPVNHRTSSLSILQDGQVVRTLHPSLSAAPEVLFASAPRLPAGDYELAWSVKSMDGEPTNGSIHFSVGPRR